MKDASEQIWKENTDLGKSVKEFMKKTFTSKVFYDEATMMYYCPNCREALEEGTCKNCHKKFLIHPKYTLHESYEALSKGLLDFEDHNYFYVFDRKDEDVYLYCIEMVVTSKGTKKNCTYRIEDFYQIKQDGILEVRRNEFLSFDEVKELLKPSNKRSFSPSERESLKMDFFVEPYLFTYLYPENLEELKNTKLYQDSKIWELKEQINCQTFSLATLTFFPICCKEVGEFISEGAFEKVFQKEESNGWRK